MQSADGLHALRHNLPLELDDLVGRERESAELIDLLTRARIVTLVGTGGSGKTRLARHVARRLVGEYEAGIWLVELDAATDTPSVARGVARALGVAQRRRRRLDASICEALRNRRLLVVLDNCEHVLDACAGLVRQILEQCPGVQVLATSRERLGLPGEVVRHVAGLQTPDGFSQADDLEQTLDYAAVRLFVDRARASDPDFRLSVSNRPHIVDICQLLEGIPLALELAAACAGVLSADQIARRLRDSLPLPASGRRGATARHRTLRAALDWSYALLSDQEQRLFERVAIFRHGWTLEGAEALADGLPDVVDVLRGLVDKSIVIAERSADDHVRYRMLETVRQYGEHAAEAHGTAEATRTRHAEFCIELAEIARAYLNGGPHFATWLANLLPEIDNFLSALRWCVEREDIERGLHLSGAAWRVAYIYGASQGHRLSPADQRPHAGVSAPEREWLDLSVRLLSNSHAATAQRVTALYVAGRLALEAGEPEAAETYFEEGLAIARELDDPVRIRACVSGLGMVAWSRGDFAHARAELESSLSVARAQGNVLFVAGPLRTLGVLLSEAGDYAASRSMLSESLQSYLRLGDELSATWSRIDLGFATLHDGDPINARGLFVQALGFFGAESRSHCIPESVEGLAGVAVRTGQGERAVRLSGAAASLREVFGHPPYRRDRQRVAAWLTPVRRRMGQEVSDALHAEGRAMSVHEIFAYALAENDEKRAPRTMRSKPMRRLTARERDVAALLAAGLANREIARSLVISEGTVEVHVKHILGKLGFRSRSQIAVWVATAGADGLRALPVDNRPVGVGDAVHTRTEPVLLRATSLELEEARVATDVPETR